MVFIACSVVLPGNVHAAGTPAGTAIINTVTVNYQRGGIPQPMLTGSNTLIVSAPTVSLAVSINKTVIVIDQWGGNQPIPGAALQYTITVLANGIANNVVISDPLPPNVVYMPNTLRLNDSVTTADLTDISDADKGDVGGTIADTVTVKLGNLTAASPRYTITFDTKIK